MRQLEGVRRPRRGVRQPRRGARPVAPSISGTAAVAQRSTARAVCIAHLHRELHKSHPQWWHSKARAGSPAGLAAPGVCRLGYLLHDTCLAVFATTPRHAPKCVAWVTQTDKGARESAPEQREAPRPALPRLSLTLSAQIKTPPGGAVV